MRIARKKLTGLLALLVAVVSVAAFALPALAAPDCPSTGCQTAQVGPFMSGISEACGEKGTCSLTDIQTVFVNVGNWVLGIVGALVLLAYVVGGFYFLISGMPGMEKYREKGKTALKQSTVGLIIVFVAYAGLTTLKNVLTGAGISPGTQYVACGPGDTNAGLACDLNSTCTTSGTCVSACEQRNATATSVSSGTISVGIGVQVQATTVSNIYMCVDVDTADTNYGLPNTFYLTGSFEQNLCPGADNIQCGNFTLNTD